MKRFAGSTLLFLLFSILSLQAMAAPILLNTINVNSTGGGTGNAALTPIGVIFHLGYVSSPSDCTQLIGCEQVWNLGETGSVEINPGNSPYFSSVVARMTDNITETLWSGAHTLDSSSTSLFPGGSSGGPDTALGLFGSSIDFFILNVTVNTLSGVGTISSSHSYIGSFEAWGNRASVPEPAIFSMLLMGLAGLGLTRYKRQKQARL